MIDVFNVTTKQTDKPIGLVLYSKSGMGKTTFLSKWIKAKGGILFQCGEDGLSDLTDKDIIDTPRFEVNGKEKILGMGTTQDELINEYIYFKEEVLKSLMLLKKIPPVIGFDGFDNLIVNNLDQYVIKTVYGNNVDKANGWGGAKLVEMDAELALIIKAFEYIQSKGTEIILSCHNQIITFKSPTEEDYSKYTLNLPARKDADLRNRLINWSSATIFGLREVEVENKKVIKDNRVLKTKEYATWDAKCRYSIPETIEFSYETFIDEVKKSKKG
jgi:hypothetical protein